jgi:hypothetical protein
MAEPRSGYRGNFAARTVPLRSAELKRTADLKGAPMPGQRKPLKPVSDRRAAMPPKPRQRKDTIPPKVRQAVHARDEHWCQHCGGHFPDGGIHLHHRRLKQAGGDKRPHTDESCNLVSVCYLCHDWLHNTAEGRRKAEAEGFIIPNAETEPGLHSILLHGEGDGGGVQAWLTCDGKHVSTAPERAVA